MTNRTFTLHDVTVAARHNNRLEYDTVRDAAEGYLRQLEELDGREIDPDAITEDDAVHIMGAIDAGHAAGDFGTDY